MLAAGGFAETQRNMTGGCALPLWGVKQREQGLRCSIVRHEIPNNWKFFSYEICDVFRRFLRVRRRIVERSAQSVRERWGGR